MKFPGLSSAQAQELLKTHGENVLPRDKDLPILILFARQFNNFFTLILFIASALSFWQHDATDGALILAILFLNASLSFWQEFKATREIKALRTFSTPTTRVIRNGKEQEIESRFLVPGDIVVLEAGIKLPADGILLEAHSFSVNESALTGESASVYKTVQQDDNAVYFSSTALTGKALMQVSTTGIKTRFGQTVKHLTTLDEEKTPLEVSLAILARNTGFIILGIAGVLFAFHALQGDPLVESFFVSVALFVAAVPEGLPAVITVILAIGVRKLYNKKTLVRRMGAVESLGATNVICTDKTGTLTQNKMLVREVVAPKEKMDKFTKTAILCNNASLAPKEGGEYDVLGDTTEGALLIWAKKGNINIDQVKATGLLIDEQPFDSSTRTMAVLWEENGKRTIHAKGAPEAMVNHCKLTEEEKRSILLQNDALAKKGLRVLLLAQGQTTASSIALSNLEYVGLVGIADTPRIGVKDVIAKARAAGIEVVMITGDNPTTSTAIAQEIGLLKPGDEVITGDQLDNMPDEDLATRLDSIRIYARTTPEHKIRIVTAFQNIGKVVAVTGDGVNDSLALKKAHIGVAMGQTGTDVAKEASDIVILNDNFETLVIAIEQGRTIYANIVKVVRFLFSANLSEVIVVLVIVLIGLPNPLLPVQLLWINLVSDGLPALALSAGKGSASIMKRAPRNIKEPILNQKSLLFIFFWGGLIGVANILIFLWVNNMAGTQAARSVIFSTIVITQMILVFIVSGKKNILENKYLFGSVAFILLLQVVITNVPFFRALFDL